MEPIELMIEYVRIPNSSVAQFTRSNCRTKKQVAYGMSALRIYAH